jgi:hypothetical protein
MIRMSQKKGAHGGNMVSPMLKSAEYKVIFSLG